MADNIPTQYKEPASPTAKRTSTAPRTQTPSTPMVARTPSVSRRMPPEEAQQPESEDYEPIRVSHVRILPTSLPYVHDQLMEQRDREQKARNQILEERRQEAARLEESGQVSERRELSPEEQAATARALKPHARSVVDLGKLHLEPPTGRPNTQPPKRSRKWQFGIRSRNQPYEAMLYLYRAIAAQGGLWDIQPVEAGMLLRISPSLLKPKLTSKKRFTNRCWLGISS